MSVKKVINLGFSKQVRLRRMKMEGILTMSQKDADRIGVISRIEINDLTIE